MFHRMMTLTLLSLLSFMNSSEVSASSLLSRSIREQYGEVIPSFRKAKSLDERRALYDKFIKRVESDLESMPLEFPESQVETAAEYIEFHSYLKELPATGLTSTTCQGISERALRLSNPQAFRDEEGSPAGLFLIKILKSICGI